MKGQLENLFERILRSEYYGYGESQVTLRGKSYRVASKMGLPGWPGMDFAAQLLAESVELKPDARVAVVGCGNGFIAAVASGLASQGEVLVLDSNYVATEAAGRTLEMNGAQNVRVVLSERMDAVKDLLFDAVLIDLPKGKELVQQLFADAHRLLALRGELYLVGANDAGIKGYSRVLERLFGNLQVLSYRKGHRVVRAIKTSPNLLEENLSTFTEERTLCVSSRGREYTLFTQPGVFSWEKLDQGTALLLEVMQIGTADKVLDLGCGCGILGLVAANLAPQGRVYLVDSHIAAVHSATKALQCNHVHNATVLVSDVISAVRQVVFDVVVTNPPFHAGVEAEFIIPLAFIAGSAQALRPGGRLYLVANRFIKYEPYLQKVYTSIRTVHEDRQFKVLQGIK